MYKYFVRRKLRWAFDRLSQKDYEALLANCSDNIEHSFAGNHALGGKRKSKRAMRKWFRRLFRLFPDLTFHIRDIIISGTPWNTRAAVRWIDEGKTADNEAYENSGVHILKLRWGKLIALDALLDSQSLAETLNRMADHEIAEAESEPIIGE